MRTFVGTVVSNRMRRTIVVRVDRLVRHPKYGKRYRAARRFKAHAEDERDYRPGDTVRIAETRPLSREKRWRVVGVIRRAAAEADGGMAVPPPEVP